MEEIKNIEKPKKKQFSISLILSLAIISFLIGLWDIKSNAAESSHEVTINIVQHEYLNDESFQDKNFTSNYISNSPIYIYHNEISIPQEKKAQIMFHLLSKEEIVIPGTIYKSEIITDKNGADWHFIQYYAGSDNIHSGYSYCFDVDIQGAEKIYILNKYYSYNDFKTSFAIDDLDTKVDYNSFEIDDNMPYPKNLKRNVMTFVDTSHFENPVNPSLGEFLTYSYDYITWENTTSEYKVQFQIMPIVQFYSQKLVGGKVFQDEKKGFWNTIDIFENDVVSYTKNTKPSIVYNEDEDSYNFYSDIVKNYDDVINGQPELFFGYRVRYIDDVNEKAGPWLTLLPTETNSHYVNSVEFSDSTVGGSDANGSNDVFNAEDTTVDNAKESIDIENEYKDKYEVIDGNADTQQVVNWLNTVVSFIKGTPNIVTSVLSFLPQPILYGMYITIFLGCIASALAIIKALI